MNRDVGKLALSPIWDFTLRKMSWLDCIRRTKHLCHVNLFSLSLIQIYILLWSCTYISFVQRCFFFIFVKPLALSYLYLKDQNVEKTVLFRSRFFFFKCCDLLNCLITVCLIVCNCLGNYKCFVQWPRLSNINRNIWTCAYFSIPEINPRKYFSKRHILGKNDP